MTTIAVIATTLASAEEARRLAAACVQMRLAACVQIEEVTSHYVWQGKAHAEQEWRMVCKTLPQTAHALRAWLRGQHPYEVPQLLTHMVEAEADYAQWVAQQVTQKTP